MRPRALIVEDEPNTRALLRALLEREGCAVDEADDGDEAMELLDRVDYGVILLDIVLPRVSGTTVMEHLDRSNPSALERVIVVTGLDVQDVRRLFPTVCHTLTKPVIPARLVESVRNCLRWTAHAQFTSS